MKDTGKEKKIESGRNENGKLTLIDKEDGCL